MADIPGQELAPRDVVAREIWREIETGETVYLDARSAIGKRMPERFPTVTAYCRNAGLDPAAQPIPVRPAAHYHMGGVAADDRGRTSVKGLWACGEVASTGLHGANRLASNSLLEALAYARWIAEDIMGSCSAKAKQVAWRAAWTSAPRAPASAAGIRKLMSQAVGVVREGVLMEAAISRLREIAFDRSQPSADLALVGLLIATAAHRRLESRGGHYRRDHPGPDPRWAHSQELTLADLQQRALRPSSEIHIA